MNKSKGFKPENIMASQSEISLLNAIQDEMSEFIHKQNLKRKPIVIIRKEIAK